VLPLLNYLRDSLNQKPFDKIKDFLGLSKSPYALTFQLVDRGELEMLSSKMGFITAREIVGVQEAMREHILKLQLAETLDVVGVFESITGKDLMAKLSLKPNEILSHSPKLSSLLDFVTTLKI
jgi:hypothetical protein